MTVRIKICGITNLPDALMATEAGAHALGFMFCESSPRYITPEHAALIISKLPPFVSKVGVFVNAAEDSIRETASACGLDTLQLHGDETPEFCARFSLPIIKAIRVKDAASLQVLAEYRTAAWLLDTYVPGQSGGTGQRFNWDLALQAKRLGGHVILAGGLNPANVAEAIQKVGPWGVDVSSGVESTPGKKDPGKVRRFIAAAIQAVK